MNTRTPNAPSEKSVRTERPNMIVLVAALLLLGIVLGAVAQIPLPLTLVLGALIGCWLLVFAVRERTRRSH
ncbi:hypothetical protein ACFWNC_06200 [Streptomyces sp. NPDC058369]|uniref:hypothetical protein n=1 Tax=Streptomyces sp. NPDC058369 TaxID=3346462 RepID=UPI003657A959